MRYRTGFLCLLYFYNASPAVAQDELIGLSISGSQAVIIDGENKQPIPGIAIINRRNRQHTFSDANGYFSIVASVHDTLVFIDSRYTSYKRAVRSFRTADTIFLQPKVNQLKTVEKLSGYALYRKDSAETRILYRKEIADAKRKPKKVIFLPPLIVQVDGLFTELAQRISGKKKRDKALLRTIEKGEQEGYTALKYNPEKVKRILHVNDSLASDFIRRHPMPYTFCVQASELEIYRWIKERSLIARR